MKFKNYNIIILFLVFTVVSCNFKNENVDPNNITEDKLELPNRLTSTEYFFGTGRSNFIYSTISNTMGQTKYQQGTTSVNNYVYSVSDAGRKSFWSSSYSGTLFYAVKLIDAATSQNAPIYRGIGKTIKAVALAELTSIWGDIPYSQIFDPLNYPNPIYDSQESIYNEIQKLLDEAILDLSSASTNSARPDKNVDFILAGDIAKWIKLAHGLKARYYLHLVKRNDNVYSLAKSELALALQSNADNVVFYYPTNNVSQQNPVYQEAVGSLNINIDPDFVNKLTSLSDPRLNFYSTVKSSLLTGKKISFGPFYASLASYIPIMTYEECLFMETEIAMYQSGASTAEPIFKKAISASLERVCNQSIVVDSTKSVAAIPITDSVSVKFINSQGNIDSLGSVDAVWNQIFYQKYIALFLQAEVWSDYRRASKYVGDVDGLPTIKPRTGDKIPRRYYYPDNEVNYNANVPPDPGIFAHIWWDIP